MPKMKFDRDHFVNGTSEIRFNKGRVYDIDPKSVDRWLKRGGVLVPDGTASDEVIEAQLNAGLAAELEKEGKATHSEVEEALEEVEELEESEDSEEEESKPRSTKKKSGKKSRG